MKNSKRKLVMAFAIICSVSFFSFQSQNTTKATIEISEASMAPTYGRRMCYIQNPNGTTSVGEWCGVAPYNECTLDPKASCVSRTKI